MMLTSVEHLFSAIEKLSQNIHMVPLDTTLTAYNSKQLDIKYPLADINKVISRKKEMNTSSSLFHSCHFI